MEIDIKAFLQLKKSENVIDLDNSIILYILDSFENGNKKKISIKKHKNNNNTFKHNSISKPTIINKSTKIIVKDNIINKIKLILNKLSQNNIYNITIEFLKNIKINTQEEFNNFLEIIYLKILSEINFVKVYLEFIKNIICIFTKSFSYKYFYDLVENKFMYDYFDITNDLYDNMSDDFRINNLKLIREMTNINFFDKSILNIIDTQILKQTLHLVDIYYWFKDTHVSKENADIIKNILSIHLNIEIRDKILLQNLISEYNNDLPKNKLVFIKKNI